MLAFSACSHKAESVKILRFEQFLFANQGNATDFQTPLLNFHPEDPEFMAALDGFVNDPIVRRVYAVTDSLYHDLSWLEQELGDAMSKARKLYPEIDYHYFYTLVTADLGNYANRVFCNLTDMAISLDCYTLGHVEEMQRFGVEVVAVDRYANAPGMQVAHRSYVINMLDGAELRRVIEQEKPDFIVPEVEAIATDTLVELEKEGFHVIPTAKATKLTMNREGIRRLAAEELGQQALLASDITGHIGKAYQKIQSNEA